jgi:hypothetical protein
VILPLLERQYLCTDCGLAVDRHLNAAIKSIENRSDTGRSKACCTL